MVVACLWPPATFTFPSVFAIILFLVVNRICIQNSFTISLSQHRFSPNNKCLLPTPATNTVKCLQRALGVEKKFQETRKLCFYLWVTLPLCPRGLRRYEYLQSCWNGLCCWTKEWKLIETKQGKVDIAKTHAAICIIRNIVIRLLFLVTSVRIGECVLFNFV